MNINLVFPPFVSLSCIPIGIATLKAYINKTFPTANVSLIDLNLHFIHKILNTETHNLNLLCKKSGINLSKNHKCRFRNHMPEQQREIFKRTKTILKDKSLFLDKDIFGSCFCLWAYKKNKPRQCDRGEDCER